MNRRKFLTYGVISPVLISQSGCVHLVLRLLVGRGAARVLTGAAHSGVRSAGMTFGRGVAVGGAATRQSLMGASSRVVNTVPAGSRIIAPSGRTVASTQRSSTGKGTYTRVDGSDILYSEQKPYGLEHDLGSTVAGRSYYKPKGVIEHRDSKGRTSGFDQIRLAYRVVKHFDRDENIIGETRFSRDKGSYLIQADSDTEKAFDEIVKAYGFKCPEVKAAYDEYIRYQDACLLDNGPCGAGTGLRRRRWRDLHDVCAKKANSH